MTQGLFSLRTEPNIDLSHKLSPRSPTMAFSSVRENVTPTLRIVLENVITHNIFILFLFYFILIFNFMFLFILCFISFYFIVKTYVIVVYCIGS